MAQQIQQAVSISGNRISVFPPPVIAERAPLSTDTKFPIGQQWINKAVSPSVIYQYDGGGVWNLGGVAAATTSSLGLVQLATLSQLQNGNAPAGAIVPLANDVATVIQGIVVGAVPPATEGQAGIAKIATQVETNAGVIDNKIVSPLKLANFIAAGGFPGVFTDLTATGAVNFTGATGALTMTSSTASSLGVTGAGVDLTLSSAAGSVIMTAGEAVADAIQLKATDAAGGIDFQAGTGGFDLDTTGAISIDGSGASNITIATGDLSIIDTASSVIINGGEAVADAIQLTTANAAGGLTASLGTGGFNSTTSGKYTLVSTDDAAQAFYLHANGGTSETIELRADQGNTNTSIYLLSDVGGITVSGGVASATAITLLTTDVAGGITMTAGTGGILPSTSGKFTVVSTDNAAQAIELHANGGVTETIRLRADQGTSATSLDLLSDVGGITLNAGLASASAINITSSAVAGGWTLNSGTAGVTLTNTGKLSLAAAAASDITVTGAFNLTLASTLGRVIATSGIAAANAITLTASDAAGGFALTSGTGGFTLTNTGALSLAGSGASNITIATGNFTITDTASSIILTSGKGGADAIQFNALTAGGGIDINLSTGGFDVDTTGAISLDAVTASNFTVTGAAGTDLTIQSTAGAVNIISGEADVDSINVTSAGGMNVVATGAAGKDIIVTNTNGSMTLTAGESVIDAMNITASGAASGLNLTAGTNGILFSSGLKVKVTSVVAGVAANPYVVLGTDFYLAVDVTGGVQTVQLPAAPATGRYLIVSDAVGQAGANTITIDGNGKNISLAGTAAGTKTIITAYRAVELIYNGTLWNAAVLG